MSMHIEVKAQALHYGRSTEPLAWIVPSEQWPRMWRVLWPDGSLSDITNRARAKEAAKVIAERGPPPRDRRMFRWQKECLETAPAGLACEPDEIEAAGKPLAAESLS
jgi:hypothetical protein